MLRASQNSVRRRRGMILIVVLSLLTLFAIVGLSFVLVSDSLALSARIAKEAETTFRPDVSPEASFSQFLGQLVYDVEDDQLGIYSGLRGHSFARTMYGYNRDNPSGNDKAFAGLGRLLVPSPYGGNPGPERYLGYLVNHTYFGNLYPTTDSFVIDPERTQVRPNPSAPYGANTYVSAAAPYTYPDHNSFFLGAAQASDGRILMPSFHRPWLFGSLDQTNPNWTSPHGKYLTPRPRPAEHPGFPYPEDLGGDVKNRMGVPGGNDSIWIDIGAPVMTSADGRKYKMLFAPLILDLDGRINLSVHGNRRGGGNASVSNQGWGPWEVNPRYVLSAPADLQQLILGNPVGAARTPGRFGPNQQPGVTGSLAPSGTVPRAWGQVDYDGEGGARFQLPGEGTPYFSFPTFPATFGNASIAERTDHPLLYNPFNSVNRDGSQNDDRRFPASTMAAVLRYGDTGGQGLTSELFRLIPNTTNNARLRNLITTASMDMDRPGATPYIWDRTLPGTNYAWNAGTNTPAAAGPFAAPFDNIPGYRPSPQNPNSEFNSVDWHSQLASLMRVNLNRYLPTYPTPDAGTGLITDMVGYNDANNARILLAQDLFERLRIVTGAPDLSTVVAATDDFRTLRYLAQLAVNMVDFIDQDDYMTVFQWHADPSGIVIGTEMPGLLINEAFAQTENLANDAGLQDRTTANATAYRINVWAELYNPRVNGPTVDGIPGPSGATALRINNAPVYRLTLASYDAANKAVLALSDPDNIYGDPAFGVNTPTQQVDMDDWPNTAEGNVVLPGGNRFNSANTAPNRNQGFYAVGPLDNDFLVEPGKEVDPAIPTTHKTARMTLPLAVNADRLQSRPMLLLRRLACPNLPAGAGNPWVTVDTFQYPVEPWQAFPFGNGANPPTVNGTFVQRDQRFAVGRFQPFAAESASIRTQAPNPALVNQAQHTFFQHNYEMNMAPALNAASTTLKTSGFDWLSHLDRQLVSPIELLNVSAWKPHQLTEKFVQAGASQKQTADWFNPATRLHRFLEFVETAPRSVGVGAGGRVPGKVNINTLNDIAVFRALCDAQGGNRFTDAQVQAIYNILIARRQPGGATTFTGTDRPFWSLAQGQAAGGDQFTSQSRGMVNTLLTPYDLANPTGGRLFDPHTVQANGGLVHPSDRLELLNKIYNNVTTRSNVFAVWVTVGYFEVRDENRRPVTLGAEIGRAEGRHVRHRMFAIVDRTRLENIRVNAAFQTAVTPQAGQRTYASFGGGFNSTNANTGKTWTLQSGAIMTFNPEGPTPETTAVFNNAGTFQGEVFQPYTTATMPMVQYGNPGPWLRYDPKKDPCILHFSVID